MVLDLGLPLLDHVLDLQDLALVLHGHLDHVLDLKNPDHALAVLEVTVKTTLARPRNVLSKRHLVVIMRTKATTTVMWKTLPRKKGNELLTLMTRTTAKMKKQQMRVVKRIKIVPKQKIMQRYHQTHRLMKA